MKEKQRVNRSKKWNKHRTFRKVGGGRKTKKIEILRGSDGYFSNKKNTGIRTRTEQKQGERRTRRYT